ncbi:MAG TPA: COX aromatic rich motif-containing protein, partial [Rhizobacter sp.]|nr:COX aromatic rich motif-containing protein [Rhizobacter sp.]
YLELERPSEREPVRRYASTASGLYDTILNRCVDPSKMCMKQMMAIDAGGGAGRQGIAGVASRPARSADEERAPMYVLAAVCTADDLAGTGPALASARR